MGQHGQLALPAIQRRRLRIRSAHAYPKVSEHIGGIIEMTQALVAKGHAYVADDGAVLGLVTLEDVLEELVGEIRDAAHH